MDFATALGLMSGLFCIVFAIMSSPGSQVFVNIPSMMITVGGMTAATFIHFSLSQVKSIFSILKKTLLCKLPSEQELIQRMVNYSAINRRDGTLALEQQLAGLDDRFLVQAVRMVIDGQKLEAMEEQLGMEIQFLQERHADGKKILEFMGSAAPAWGMIGTLIGLVQMLGTLENPDEIGRGMATALITTFYGSFLSNLVFLPLAGKLGIRSKQESIRRQMVVVGVTGLASGDSPTLVREKMQAFLSANQREELRPKV